MPRPRPSYLDRFALEAALPPPPPHPLTLQHKSLLNAKHQFISLLDRAFPRNPPHLAYLLDRAAAVLSDALHPFDSLQQPHIFLQTMAESSLLDHVAHAFIVTEHQLTHSPPKYAHHLKNFLAKLLRFLNLATSADFLTRRLATHPIFPVLFRACFTPDMTDMVFAIVEELLSQTLYPLDLSTITNLPHLVNTLTPFHLGTLCRVLVPLVDERHPTCTNDQCQSQSLFPDWRQLQDSTAQLRARASYTNATIRVFTDRNHATLLSIPNLLPRLVKLISVPPARRQDLVLVDHAARTGVFTLGAVDATDLYPDPANPQPIPLLNVPPSYTSEEHVRRRIVAMVFRRLTGLDVDDGQFTGSDNWHVFDRRIAEAQIAHARGITDRNNHHHHPSPPSSSSSPPTTTTAPAKTPATASTTNPRERDRDPVDDVSTTATASDTGDAHEPPPIPPNIALDAQDLHDYCPLVSINCMLMSSHQIDVLFVLYSLLIGKRNSDVQNALIQARVLPALNRFCDGLDWTEHEEETRTEDSLKVHFIRLMHYLCDAVDENSLEQRRTWMFTESERRVLTQIEQGKRPAHVPSASPLANLHVCAGMNLQEFQKLTLSSSWPVTNRSHSSEASRMERPCPVIPVHTSICPSRSSPLVQVPGDAVPFSAIDDNCNSCNRGKQPLANGVPTTQHSAPKKSPRPVDTTALPDHERGLMSKLVSILINTTGHSEVSITRRFLLSGCIETFQRSATVAEKTFVARQGLLSHLVEQLAECDVHTPHLSQFRQTGFDLLGQLVKWNRQLFNDMNDIFRRDRRIFVRLLRAVSDRLVDSNVFVRSLVLSLEKFHSEDDLQRFLGDNGKPDHQYYDFDNCYLWDFVETYRVRLVYDLLSSVRVEDITFENICCVNTALILFVVSCPDAKAVDDFLSKLTNMTVDLVKAGVSNQTLLSLKPGDVMANFIKLVDFWHHYYRHQGADVFSVEVNTNISFTHFVSMADLLCKRIPLFDAVVKDQTSHIPQL